MYIYICVCVSVCVCAKSQAPACGWYPLHHAQSESRAIGHALDPVDDRFRFHGGLMRGSCPGALRREEIGACDIIRAINVEIFKTSSAACLDGLDVRERPLACRAEHKCYLPHAKNKVCCIRLYDFKYTQPYTAHCSRYQSTNYFSLFHTGSLQLYGSLISLHAYTVQEQ